MLFLLNWSLGLIFAVIHVLIRKPRRSGGQIKTFSPLPDGLSHRNKWSYRVLRALSLLRTDRTEYRGVPHKQFQFELGAGELGWAIAGFLSIVIRKPLYWLGVSIVPIVMCLLSAWQHIWEVIALGNYSPNNLWAGVADLIGPLTFLILFGWYFMLTRKETSRER